MDQDARRTTTTTTPIRLAGALGLAVALVGSLLACGPAVPPSASPASASPTSSLGTPVPEPSSSAACTATPSVASSVAPSATPSAAPSATPAATVRPSPTPRPSPASTPSPRPTPRPTRRPTPTAGPTTHPTPTPTATTSAGPSTLLRHGPRAGNDVALTFDMGGRVGDALAIMGWLVDHDVHATVFMTGAMARNQNTDAGRRVLAIIEAHPTHFTLGNHSFTHRDFRNLSAAEILEELRSTEAAIAPYCDQNPRPFFRPPNGGYDAGALAAVGAAGYRWTVLWDVDTIDWRPIANDPPGPTADQIVAKVLANVQGGSIVLMHLGGYETLEALPRIVDGLRDRGFDLVTLDELV